MLTGCGWLGAYETATLDIIRISKGRQSYIDSAELPKLNKSGEYRLSWRQKSDGDIDILIDNEQVIKTSHQAFRYGFKYLGMVNRSGDFSIASIEVLGGR
ncbi:MAG: hypothetical protein CSA42_00300 [Gammaproteobacteria bacterium]|nr:MAG: hypothetical protein CSA42_00300 [Gammaproteobacteria bacterium]